MGPLAEAEGSYWVLDDAWAMELPNLPGNCCRLQGIHFLCLVFCPSDYEFPQEQVILFWQKSVATKVHGIFMHHGECSHNREMIKTSLVFVQTEQEDGEVGVTPSVAGWGSF